MNRPRLLDLYSGAGGCSMGYHRAGFDVVGVDLKPMPRYPFEFYQADALEFVRKHGHEFDAIHASPPCQKFSAMTICRPDADHPDLVQATRHALEESGLPWVIENVVGAPLNTVIELCGVMFGLKVYRHRRFESNVMMLQPWHLKHPERMPRAGRGASPGGYICVVGNSGDVKAARRAMDIDWMNRDELSQAIPPAYTEYIGRQVIAYLDRSEAA